MKLAKDKKADTTTDWIIGFAIAIGLLLVVYIILSGWGKSAIGVLKSIFR